MGKPTTYYEKMRQASREARATLVALACTIVVWTVLGFGLSGCGASVFHTPVWVVGGTVGTWLFAIGVAVFLGRRVIADVDLDEEGSSLSERSVSSGLEAETREGAHRG